MKTQVIAILAATLVAACAGTPNEVPPEDTTQPPEVSEPTPLDGDRAAKEEAFILIREFEGWRAQAYNDPAGFCTIGYGHLIRRSTCTSAPLPAPYDDGLTLSEGEALMRDDASIAANAVNDLVEVDLNDNQFDALVDFVFNIGSGNFASSTLLVRLNERDFEDVSYQLRRWVFAGGQKLAGLERRRNAEVIVFYKPEDDDIFQPLSARTTRPVDPADMIDITIGEGAE